jgi:hypothetical protein
MEDISFSDRTYTQNLNPQIGESTFLRNVLNLTKLQDIKTPNTTLWKLVTFPSLLVDIKYLIYNSGSQKICHMTLLQTIKQENIIFFLILPIWGLS